MLRSIEEIQGYSILARDGEIGEVTGFLFDDVDWAIRYLVVTSGGWLLQRQVLVSPYVIGKPDWMGKVLPVGLSREQVKESPDVDLAKPVSRQQEVGLHMHYGWPAYWKNQRDLGDKSPDLRSTREVIGYQLQALDGRIGHVEDFILDDNSWIIRYMVIDTRDWLPGKKVLVAPDWIADIDWYQQSVSVDLKRENIKNSPEYDPSAPVNRTYEQRLYDYYGRPRYWD